MPYSVKLDRYANSRFIYDAVLGLGHSQTSATTYHAIGDRMLEQAIREETYRKIKSLIANGNDFSIAIYSMPFPLFEISQFGFAISKKSIAKERARFRKRFPNAVARVFPIPAPSDGTEGFIWTGRIAICDFRFGADEPCRELFKLDGMPEVSVSFSPDWTDESNERGASEILTCFQQYRISEVRAAMRMVRKIGMPKNARFQAADGCLQFDTLVPNKLCTFSSGIGQDIVKRALVCGENDMREAKKRGCPDQLELLHEWWAFASEKRNCRLDPLAIRS